MYNLQGSRVLVTGAAGFVGANLVSELVRGGTEVHALVRPRTDLWRIRELIPKLKLLQVDLTDCQELQRTVKRVRPEVIFHLAASGGHPGQQSEREETLRSSILGTANLLEAVTPFNFQRLVHIGSSLEYGVKNEPLKESDRPEPSTFRGAAKAAATLLCQQFAGANRRPVVVLRLFSVYGYWEASTRLVPAAILAALRDQEIALTPPGYRRDFIFVEDVIEACLLALQTEKVLGEIINVGSGEQWSNEEVVDMIQAASGHRVRVQVGAYPPRVSDTHHWVADIRKAKELLGWETRHTLRRGLEKTIAWFRLHQDIYEAAACHL